MEKALKQYKSLLLPVGLVVLMIIGSFYAASFLLNRINLLRSEAEVLNEKNKVLDERLSTLQSLSPELRASANVASIAIPDRNPSILITRQLRSLASQESVGISNFTMSSLGSVVVPGVEEDPVLNYNIDFVLFSADYESLSRFIDGMAKITPLVNLVSLRVEDRSLGGYESSIRLSAYSAPFPSELPALDEPLAGLSQGEMETLQTLESFSVPELTSGGTATGAAEVSPRENPFSL